MTIRPAGLDHVVLRVSDVDRMIAFYVDVVGCSVDRVQEGLGLWQLRAGRSLIDLVDVTGTLGQLGGAAPGDAGRNMDHFCLRIDPWDEATIVAHLEAHGVAVSDTGQRYGAEGTGPSIYINDPEGNVVELKGPATA
ncbi:MAG: VOC family protein [Alphaproteobacteria bacterium]